MTSIDDEMQAHEDGKNTNKDEATTTKMTAEGEMGLWSHLAELRSRLIKACIVIFVIFIICFFGLSKPLYEFLAQPMRAALASQNIDPSFYFSAAFAPIITQIRLSFLAAIFFGFPFLCYQIWGFIAPGLYKREKQITIPVLVGTPTLFLAGALFARFLMFPIVFRFAVSFTAENLNPLIDMSKYLTDSVRLILAFGICFELPLLLCILSVFGIIEAEQLKRWRRYFVLVAAVVGALLTPSDLLSMFLLAFPLLALYELSIFVIIQLEKRRETEQA
ncbi:MAG: twin-arginine translocase subunit TatC [Alphaproteobacteria bacterium]